MAKMIDLTGQRFGRLTVVSYSHSNDAAVWRCKCDCGADDVMAKTGHLRSNTVQSCGCMQKEAYENNLVTDGRINRTHGMSRHPLDNVFDNMLKRCYDPKNHRYKTYGGRGIKICDEWLDDRGEFYRWGLANGWEKGLTIDRVDNDGDYTPDNCRFTDRYQQMNNTTRNVYLTWKGETKSIAEWAREIGTSYISLQHRVYRGWSTERIFTQPFRKTPRKPNAT